MAEHTFVDGDPLPASDVETYLKHTGGAWNTYTPAVVQSTTPTLTVNKAGYHRDGRRVTVAVVVTITSTATANNQITVTLPVTAATYPSFSAIGSGWIQDNSASAFYQATAVWASATTVSFFTSSTTTNNLAGQTGSAFSAALANNDVISFTATYEAAAG